MTLMTWLIGLLVVAEAEASATSDPMPAMPSMPQSSNLSQTQN
jgi:hypothetical protein